MRKKRLILIVATLLFAVLESFAQIPAQDKKPISNLRKKRIPVVADTIRIDTLSVIPKTFFIESFSDSAYSFDHVNALLKWKIIPSADSVTIVYRVFPYKLNSVVQRMNFDSVSINFMQNRSSLG